MVDTHADATEIERIEAPDREEFERKYLLPGRPVLISGVVDRWPAASRWNPDYLVSRVGKNLVPVRIMPKDGDYAQAATTRMELAEYVRALSRDDERPEVLYLAEVSLARYFPELLEEIERPPYFNHERPWNAVLYLGRRQFSQLHYHPRGSATLCQLHGHKRVRLFAPDQTRYLYKYAWYSRNHNMSRTTSSAPDPGEFPRFSNARGTEFVIGPGEMLFIPIYWWHSVQNEELNIAAVFFWYRDRWSRWLPPPGMRADYLYELAQKTIRDVKRAPASLLKRPMQRA